MPLQSYLLRNARTAARRLQSQLNKTQTFGAVFSTQAQTHESESFLTGTSSIYAEQMYELYQQDPHSVDASWKQYFDNLEAGVAYDEGLYSNPTSVPSKTQAAAVSVQE